MYARTSHVPAVSPGPNNSDTSIRSPGGSADPSGTSSKFTIAPARAVTQTEQANSNIETLTAAFIARAPEEKIASITSDYDPGPVDSQVTRFIVIAATGRIPIWQR